MIHYELQCDRAHDFDGWFKDSLSFDDQAKTGLIACPICNSVKVARALMAPALGRGSHHGRNNPLTADGAASAAPRAPNIVTPSPLPPAPTIVGDTAIPDRLRALLQRFRSEIESSCDYVGAAFAEEARRIHHGESAARSIYGETTPAEAEALADEGVEFGVIPWLPRSDS